MPQNARPAPPPPTLLDAQQMHRQHPRTFQVPTQAALRGIRPGDCVKVCDAGARERFWVVVRSLRPGGILTGRVDNQLLSAPYALGASISFRRRNVLDIRTLRTR